MRTSYARLLGLLLLVSPTRAYAAYENYSLAACDTAKTPTTGASTRSSLFRIAAAHLDWGGGTGPGSGAESNHGAIQLTVAHCRWPDWSMSLAGSAQELDRTSYVGAGSNPALHPHPEIATLGVELGRRWRQESHIHPFAEMGAGFAFADYHWAQKDNGEQRTHWAERSNTPYVSLRAGGEINLSRNFRGALLVGERMTGNLNTAEVDPKRAQGFMLTFLLELGKFR